MLRMTHRIAGAMLEYAEDNNLLDEVYHQALIYMANGYEPEQLPDSLKAVWSILPERPDDVKIVFHTFIDMARERMNMLDCEIISAVELKPEQVAALEQRFIRAFRKRLDIKTTIDPSLLGGLRVIINNTILDDSIKRKMADMKSSIYKGVYMNS